MNKQISSQLLVPLTKEQLNNWRNSSVLLALLLLVWGVIFWQSLLSMVGIWWVNDTFSHGFFVIPIAIWLIWRDRSSLMCSEPRPWVYGVLLIGGLSVLWLIAELVGVQAVQHLAVVSIIPALVLTVMGWEIAKKIWFPLLFILFAAPVGDFLVPPLMELTARITVYLLQLTGFPVLREGMLITIPSGVFEVEHACSGISYLIASVVLGTVYAHISYRALWRKLLFILMSILVPLIANGLRAYGIVLLAHYSDYSLAVGVDHLLYGGVFFAFVMSILFWLGGFWRDDATLPADENRVDEVRVSGVSVGSKYVLAFSLSFLTLLLGPGANFLMASGVQSNMLSEYGGSMLPAGDDQLKVLASQMDWVPSYRGATKAELVSYQYNEQVFSLYIANYNNQRQGAELISADNKLFDAESWRVLNVNTLNLGQPDRSLFEYKVVMLSNGHRRRLIIYWYQIGGEIAVTSVVAKLYEGWNKLRGQSGSAVVAIAVDYSDELDDVLARVVPLITYMLPRVDQGLQAVRGN